MSRTGRRDASHSLDLELVVPTLNEERRLPATLDALADALAALPVTAAIVVVDNGSVDRTAALCADRAVPIRVVGCAEAGKGAAVRRGLQVSGARWVGFCDADLATSPECIRPAVDALTEGHAVVVGSRAHPDAHVEVRASHLRRIGAWAFRRYAASVVPDVTDTQCGFKFFDGPLARAVADELVATGFAFDVELLGRMQRHVKLHEIPVVWVDAPGSTFSPRRDGLAAFREVAAIRRRLRALPAAPTPIPPLSPDVTTLVPAPRLPAEPPLDAAVGS